MELRSRNELLNDIHKLLPKASSAQLINILQTTGIPKSEQEAKNLPLDLISHIFTFLSLPVVLGRACRFCQHWYVASQQSNSWHSIRLNPPLLRKETGYHLAYWAQRWQDVQIFNFDDWKGEGDIGLTYVLRTSRCLQSLSLRHCSGLTEACLVALASSPAARSLQRVSLDGCTWLSDTGLNALGQCTGLERLSLVGCSDITSEGIHYLRKCQRMTQIDLSECSSLDDQAVSYLTEVCIRFKH